MRRVIPFDSEPRYSRLLREDIPANAFNVWLGGGFVAELLRVVLVVDVVSHPDEFPAVVAAAKQNHRHSEDFRGRYPFQVGGISFEDEFVHANWNRPNEEGV